MLSLSNPLGIFNEIKKEILKIYSEQKTPISENNLEQEQSLRYNTA
jgi:hypothetical protein